MDMPNIQTNVHCIGNETKTAEDNSRNVRMHQMEVQVKNSPDMHDIKRYKLAGQWRQVGIGDANVYAPGTAPVVVISTANQRIAFGEVESRDEVIAPNVEAERW